MRFELGNVSTTLLDSVSAAVQGSPQILSQGWSQIVVRIPLQGSNQFSAMESTVDGTGLTSGVGSVTGNSYTLITHTGERLFWFGISEAQISISTFTNFSFATGFATAARDMLYGRMPASTWVSSYLGGNDTLVGNSFANALSGGPGNDRLIGGGGIDVIDGGTGTDTSVCAELARTDYLVSRHSNGTVTVATRDGSTERNTNVETLEFMGGVTVAASSIAYLPGHTEVPGNSVQPVYRFYNDRDKAFFYTQDAGERDMIIRESTDPAYTPANGVWPYFYQGATFEQAHSSNGSVAVYRFYNTKTGHHFFTTSPTERDMVQKESTDPAYGQPGPLWTFVYEGEAFRAFTDPNHTDAAPVYRFYSPSLDRHFFTASTDEAAQIRLTGLWTDEGIGYWGEKTG